MNCFDRICNVLERSLAIDPESITRETNLMRDLGAESIDLLDVMYHLEHEFNIMLPRGEIERRTRGEMTPEEFAPDGILSPSALARLHVIMPEVPETELKPGLKVREIPRLMTVATLERLVNEEVERQSLARIARASSTIAAGVSAPLA
jgi:acyl carrier protein